jgi:hypothetical protein
MQDIQKNIERYHANYAQFTLTDADADFFRTYARPVNILILAEDWCGDVVQNLPPIIRMFEQNALLDYRIFKRDEHPDIMDRYLTDGSRSIPYLVFMDTGLNEMARWGPRPTDCQAIMRNNKGKIPMEEIYPQIRAWYKTHGHGPLIQEIRGMLAALA